MKVSLDLINSVIRTIRQVERQNAILLHTPGGEILANHLLDNEMYFSMRLKNDQLQKFNYYERKILDGDIEYKKYFDDAYKLIELREINDGFVSELLRSSSTPEYKIPNLGEYNKSTIDYVVEASKLFYTIYTDFPTNNLRYEIAATISSAFLYKKTNVRYGLQIAEVINSNSVLFQSSFLDPSKFVVAFLKLVEVQVKKNIERINKCIELSKRNEDHFTSYSKNVKNFLDANSVFTISEFTESCELSYNTSKKYLKELVLEGYLTPVKISRNNAFIYTELYEIWLK